LNDQDFLHAFETATLSSFPHLDHVRMAWLYLRRDGWEAGYRRIQAGLKHFAQVAGEPDKYHETITCFWAKLVWHNIQQHPDCDALDDFLGMCPILLDRGAMSRHYSDDVLWSAEARQNWVAPDLIPMP